MYNIKKRAFFAIILSIVVLFALNKFWLVFKPINVNIKMSGNENIALQVLLNKKADTKFKKVKSQTKAVFLNKDTDINIEIERSKSPKAIRLKLILPYKNSYAPIVIKNISVENYNIDNFKLFDIEGANVIQKDKVLEFIPNSEAVILTYNQTFRVHPHTIFDVQLFIIISVLSFLLFYKLTDYLVDFKSIKRKNLSDIVFLTIFFTFLFIPMVNIDKSDISTKENRVLAKWRPFILSDNEINFNFGKDFNNWFNDRFNLRSCFLKIHSSIISCFYGDYFENKNIIYNKKNNFAYNKSLNSQNVFLKKNTFSDNELKIIYQKIDELQKYCQKNNVKLFLILSSDKESIYPEFYPNYYTPEKNPSAMEQVVETLRKVPNLNLIVPRENLIKEKEKNLIFEPYDTHLNGRGAYVEYYSIIESTKKYYKEIQPISFSNIEILKSNLTCDTLPPDKFIDENFQNLETIKVKNSTANLVKKDSIVEYRNINAKNNLKATIVGDSFHTKYLMLLCETFYNLKSLFIGGGGDFILKDEQKNKLFNPKPDILYIETSERFLRRLINLDSFFDIFEKN